MKRKSILFFVGIGLGAAICARVAAPCEHRPAADGREAPAGSSRPDYPIQPVPFTDVHVQDGFWRPRQDTNCAVTIPFGFRQCEETGRIDNFRKAAGQLKGTHQGKRYNDSDVFKLIEAAAYSLCLHPDPALDGYLDKLIGYIAAAQEADGYLYTARTIDPQNPPPGSGAERWSALWVSHELYNMGHLYEAAVAHFQATGKRTLLGVALKNADLLAREFGPGKRGGAPGHPEIEIGLAKLFRNSGKKEYLELARFFLGERGKPYAGMKPYAADDPFAIYGDAHYLLNHQAVVSMSAATGHAVRAAYLYSGMADVAALSGDPALVAAGDRLWRDVVGTKLYLTGGIGARGEGEAFGAAYELPNDTAYCETCAAIANVLWNQRLFLLHGDARFYDVLERTLYNGLLAGVSFSGDRFFYTNPLESDGQYPFNEGSWGRQPWFEVSCCPVNLARFLPSLAGYIYARKGNSIYVNLFVASTASLDIAGRPLQLRQQTDYPWEGRIMISVQPEREENFTLRLRIPGWALNHPMPADLYSYLGPAPAAPELRIGGRRTPLAMESGYAVVDRTWKKGDTVELILPMAVRRVAAHNQVVADRGRIALERGPLVYCLEGIDHDGDVLAMELDDRSPLLPAWRPEILGGVMVLQGQVRCEDKPKSATAIPYYAWANRGQCRMAVWLKRSEGGAGDQ